MVLTLAETRLNEKINTDAVVGNDINDRDNGSLCPHLNVQNKSFRSGEGRSAPTMTSRIEEVSGQNLSLCYQCGLCAGGCPAGSARDLLPHQILHLVQLGQWDRIKNSRTAWLCASCFTCTVKCPRGVDIARLMDSVRRLALRQNTNNIAPETLASATLAEFPQIAMVSCLRRQMA